jgi:uncharacterized repeat protein (TIGR03803 family)
VHRTRFLISFLLAAASVLSAQSVSTMLNFNGTNGADPLYVTFVQGRDGRLYGTTYSGAANDLGAVVRVSMQLHPNHNRSLGPSPRRRLSADYFWLASALVAGAAGCGKGNTLGAIGFGGAGGVRGNGEALPRRARVGRWCTICPLPGAGAM